MVIVQFCGRLVQQYIVDYLGLGITCLIITVLCVQGIPIMSLDFYAIPIFPI